VNIDTRAAAAERSRPAGYASRGMNRTWIWTQVAIIVFVLIGMVIAIIRLA